MPSFSSSVNTARGSAWVRIARAAREHSTPFPPFTQDFECGCGCGYEGECELAQWLIEDAMLHGLDILDALDRRETARADAVAAAEQAVAERLAQARRAT